MSEIDWSQHKPEEIARAWTALPKLASAWEQVVDELLFGPYSGHWCRYSLGQDGKPCKWLVVATITDIGRVIGAKEPVLPTRYAVLLRAGQTPMQSIGIVSDLPTAQKLADSALVKCGYVLLNDA
jgi:hypothetical protein